MLAELINVLENSGIATPSVSAHPLVNGKWDEGCMGGGARLLSFLKLSFLYIGAIDFVNIRIQPLTNCYSLGCRCI